MKAGQKNTTTFLLTNLQQKKLFSVSSTPVNEKQHISCHSLIDVIQLFLISIISSKTCCLTYRPFSEDKQSLHNDCSSRNITSLPGTQLWRSSAIINLENLNKGVQFFELDLKYLDGIGCFLYDDNSSSYVFREVIVFNMEIFNISFKFWTLQTRRKK